MSLADAATLLQTAEPDRLAALLLLPPGVRPGQVALHALAVELGRVPRASAEPMLAEIRLQWWIDELARLPASAGLHPLLAALAEARGQGLPQEAALVALAEGQRPACAAEPFADLAEAVSWIDATAGALAWTAAQALGAGPAGEAAIRAQGRALGIAACLLRGAPRPLDEAQVEALRGAGRQAAAEAAAGAAAVPRAAAPVLFPGPVLQAALDGGARPSEFGRRAALAGFLLRRDWRFRRPR